jgi:uncharacterized protein (TIGR02284 family)
MALVESTIRTVIEVLHDGQRCYASLSEYLKDQELKTFFSEEASHRGRYAVELENALSTVSGKKIKEGGTAAGTVHRAWGQVKGNLGGSDHTLLETAEKGEDAAKKAYADALKISDIPAPIRTLLEKQKVYIHHSHNKVKAFRDSFAVA